MFPIKIFGVKNNLFRAVERGETFVEIIFLLARATLWRSPQLNRIDRYFQIDDADGQGGGHRNAQEKHHPRPSSTDCTATKTSSTVHVTNINKILQVPQEVKKDSSAFSMDAPARSMKDPSK